MPVYVYQAFDPENGRLFQEEGEFQDLRELFLFLQSQGLILIKYRHKYWKEIWRRGPSRRELAEFCRNLALLIRAGIPLIQALGDLKKTTKHKALKISIGRLIRNLTEGRSLSEGLRKDEKLFAPIILALIHVGEETGRLDETLERAADHLLRVEEIVSNTKRALLYPLFVLVSMGGALLFWIFFVFPKILELFKEFGTNLPWATRLLLESVKFSKTYWAVFLLWGLVSLAVAYALWRWSPTRLFLEKLLLQIPLIGPARRLSMMAFFYEYLALLFEAGLDAIRCFEIIGEAHQNPFLRQTIGRLKEALLEGFPLATAFEEIRLFNPLELRMIRVGEESGRLIEQFRYLADYYYQALEAFVNTLSKVIEPILIILAGLLFLALALALLGPIYDLIGNLGAYQ